MTERTVLGQVALQLADRPEDYAVEALNYVLGSSDTARNEAIALLMPWNRRHLDLRFRSQVVGENSRPDIVGANPDGTEMLIVEAKFWAGLTDAQPVEYISRLSSDEGSTLSFLAPDARIESLWRELVARTSDRYPEAQQVETVGSSIKALKIGSGQYVSLVSWSSLTGALTGALERNGELAVAGDVHQLAGLCSAMDEDAFLPLQAHEAGPDIPRRILQLYRLVTDVVEQAQTRGIAETAGMLPTGDSDGWGRYFRIEGLNVWLGVKFSLWASQVDTPLWFRLQSSTRDRFQTVRQSYAGWELQTPARIVYDERDVPSFPMYLKFGMDRDQLVNLILDQIVEIVEPLKDTPVRTQDLRG